MIKKSNGQWVYTPSIPALRRQRQVDLYEFEARLVYKEIFRTASVVTQRNHVLGKEKINKNLPTN